LRRFEMVVDAASSNLDEREEILEKVVKAGGP
jgi:hypothetical protein